MDTVRENTIEFVDPTTRPSAQLELNIAERVAAERAGNQDKAVGIDVNKHEHQKTKHQHRNVRKYRASVFKSLSSKDNSPS